MRICFDLDGVICNQVVKGYYWGSVPNNEVVDLIQRLHKQGHTIIIHTARKMNTYKGNVGRVQATIGQLTFDQLNNWQVPYDEIYFGKPAAELYIDDKACLYKSAEQLEEEINGVYIIAESI